MLISRGHLQINAACIQEYSNCLGKKYKTPYFIRVTLLAAGVDWKTVKNETDMTEQLSHLLDQLYSSENKRKLKT